jgi:peptidyl-prolyl cis-trans isomerase D
MFDFIRNNRRFLQVVLLLLVLPSFVLFGIQGYSNINDGAYLASVGQQRISQADLDYAVRNRLEEVKKSVGDKYDAKLYDTPEARQKMLEGIVNQKVLLAESGRSNVMASDSKVLGFIKDLPGVFDGGKYNEEAYKRVIAPRSMVAFEANTRADMGVQTLFNAVQSTSLVSKQVVEQLTSAQERTITVQELSFKAEKIAATIKLESNDLDKFYAEHIKRFELPEQASVEYITLDATAVGAIAMPTEAELKQFYDAELKKKRFTVPEERRFSHLLIKLDSAASSDVVASAKAKADTLFAQLQKDPSQFARLAKESSDDVTSAAQGGDLGFFTRESMAVMGKSLVEAAFSANTSQVIPPVKTDYGWHIAVVTAIKAAQVKPYEVVKSDLEAELKGARAITKLLDQKKELANELGLLRSDASLKTLANQFKLEVKTIDGLSHDMARQLSSKESQSTKVFNSKVVEALFSKESIDTKNNIGLIEVDKNTWVTARLLSYASAKAQPLEQIKEKVEAQLRHDLAVKQAQVDGEAKLKLLRAKPDMVVEGLSSAQELSRQKPNGLSSSAFASIARASVGTLPTWAGVALPNGNYAVYKITALGAVPKVDDLKRNAIKQALTRAYAEQELQSVLSVLKARHSVKFLKKPSAADTADTVDVADPTSKAK